MSKDQSGNTGGWFRIKLDELNMNNQKPQKYNSPYLSFSPKNKVFTLKLKDNEVLHYVNKDDALFIELYIYSMVSVPNYGIKGAAEEELSKMKHLHSPWSHRLRNSNFMLKPVYDQP